MLKDTLALGTREEFWESVARADEDFATGRFVSAQDMTDSLRAKHGLWGNRY